MLKFGQVLDFSFSLLFSLLFLGVHLVHGNGGLGDLAKILSALAGENECRFRCPHGFKPLNNPAHIPSSNGCGSFGITVDTSHIPGFTTCCDNHDKCYDTCNNDRNQCDEDFKSCLDNVCLLEGLGNRMSQNQLKECQNAADLMYSGTVGFGCAAYKESQRKACVCNGRMLTVQEVEKMDEADRQEL